MYRFVTVLLLTLAALSQPFSSCTVTGTFVYPNQTAITNGFVQFVLHTRFNQAVQQKSTGATIQPGLIATKFLNGSGVMPSTTLVSNDDIVQPYSYYEVDVFKAQNQQVGTQYFWLCCAGSSFNMGNVTVQDLQVGQPSVAPPTPSLYCWPTTTVCIGGI